MSVYILTREMQGYGCSIKSAHATKESGLAALKDLFEQDKGKYRTKQYSFPDWQSTEEYSDEAEVLLNGGTTWRMTGMGMLYWALVELEVQS